MQLAVCNCVQVFFYFSVVAGSCYVVVSLCVFLCRNLQRGPQAECGCGGDRCCTERAASLRSLPREPEAFPAVASKNLANSHPIPKHRSCTPSSPSLSCFFLLKDWAWCLACWCFLFKYLQTSSLQKAGKYLAPMSVWRDCLSLKVWPKNSLVYTFMVLPVPIIHLFNLSLPCFVCLWIFDHKRKKRKNVIKVNYT